MAMHNDKPQVPLSPTISPTPSKRPLNRTAEFAHQLGGRLVRLEDDINKLVSSYAFHHAAVFELMARQHATDNGQFLLGLNLTSQWLAQRGRQTIHSIEDLQKWVRKKL